MSVPLVSCKQVGLVEQYKILFLCRWGMLVDEELGIEGVMLVDVLLEVCTSKAERVAGIYDLDDQLGSLYGAP